MRFLLLILLLLGCDDRATVTVGAASSLAEVMPEIAAAYEVETGVRVQLVFASSGKIVQQQLAGAGYDVTVLADDSLDGTPVAGNRLVLVGVGSLDELDDIGRVAIGAPDTVPAGKYARQALQSAGVWDDLDGRLVYGANVRQVLAYVQRGEVDAALVYATDAEGVPIDPALHDPIDYRATYFTDTGDRFAGFLHKPTAGLAFEAHGFVDRAALLRNAGVSDLPGPSVAEQRGSEPAGAR
ncbi:MAG: molybdate ABC transporter substrate-binding protein [Planctomycetota bacterium]